MEGLSRKQFETILNELTILGINCPLTDLGTIITAVIEERMADPVEMNSDLMSPSCLKTTLHNSNISKSFQNTIMRHSMLAMIPVREYLETRD